MLTLITAFIWVSHPPTPTKNTDLNQNLTIIFISVPLCWKFMKIRISYLWDFWSLQSSINTKCMQTCILKHFILSGMIWRHSTQRDRWLMFLLGHFQLYSWHFIINKTFKVAWKVQIRIGNSFGIRYINIIFRSYYLIQNSPEKEKEWAI